MHRALSTTWRLGVCALLSTGLAANRPVRAQEQAHTESLRHNRHLLIDVGGLATALAAGTMVAVHVGRTDSAYLAGHIPGARYLPLAAVATTRGGVSNEFPPLEQMADAFSDLIIMDNQRIVLYGDDAGLLATRAWAALDLLGHGDHAALLDGGLAAWRAAGQPVEAGPVTLPEQNTPLRPSPRERLVDAAWVRAHLGDSTVLLVDARPADQHAGAEPPCAPGATCVTIPEGRRGTIPGARNLYWMDALVSRENPVMRPMHELHHALWQAAGADRPEVRTIVVFCRTGLQASHAYWQARYIGYPDVRLYDGSFSEWASLAPEQYPVRQ